MPSPRDILKANSSSPGSSSSDISAAHFTPAAKEEHVYSPPQFRIEPPPRLQKLGKLYLFTNNDVLQHFQAAYRIDLLSPLLLAESRLKQLIVKLPADLKKLKSPKCLQAYSPCAASDAS